MFSTLFGNNSNLMKICFYQSASIVGNISETLPRMGKAKAPIYNESTQWVPGEGVNSRR